MLNFALEYAILETLAYSDVFDYPLRLDELHRYLTCRATPSELLSALARLQGQVDQLEGYYFIAGRAAIVSQRKQRQARSRPLLRRALQYGRVLGRLPFVRMVGLTGSLAVGNCDSTADFDYMLVTEQGRVWTARALALAFGRITRLWGDTICPNIIISEIALEWPWHDLYSARELCQMIPITGIGVYHRLRAANRWTEAILPNASSTPAFSEQTASSSVPEGGWSRFLRGALGDALEHWEMRRKIARLSHQGGLGEETRFTADVCQGNFHHHRRQTYAMYQARLSDLGIATPLYLKETVKEVT
jgi:hypothetical protein